MKALIVVDMQNDFITGSLGSDLTKAVVPNVVDKIKNEDYDLLVFTQDTHEEDYLDTLEGQKLPIVHCIQYSNGWQIIDEIKNITEDIYIPMTYVPKNTFGFEGWRNLFDTDEEIDEIEICGVCTDICVVSNALVLRMLYPNVKITVDAKCCAGTSVEAHNAALATMKSCQIDVVE